MSYKLSPLAQRQIGEILPYSMERFGAKRTQKYLNELFDKIEYLAQRPQAGRPVTYHGKDYLRYPQESHIIYYRRIGEDILIAAVLGQAQDPKRHLR